MYKERQDLNRIHPEERKNINQNSASGLGVSSHSPSHSLEVNNLNSGNKNKGNKGKLAINHQLLALIQQSGNA